MAWNTGSSSPGELEMMCNTSEVAVCCCRDSRSSLSSRVFSIAMTAWKPSCSISWIQLKPFGVAQRMMEAGLDEVGGTQTQQKGPRDR